ncbi:hypothetical protein DYB26_011400 [Aphanomyces astaci]|uniref:Uncharacterized protein n=1 Tax=Aphanomyces astaci TaxID=112090 RepID=A0A397DCD4_APHAT|nr:hypothetical protein DYB38_011601 [Aphanomyces astaci]RHZ11445.1 hypothetical protein DYB26_011400 [Aphanomyces astaci]
MDGYVNMCRWFHCDVLLHDPNYQLAGGIALTDEYTGAHGGVGIIFESGEAGDTSRMAAVADAVLRILTHEMAMLPVDTAMPPPPSQPTAFEITEVRQESCKERPGGFIRNFDRVPANEMFATVHSVDLCVPYESFIVFPKVPSLWKVGS